MLHVTVGNMHYYLHLDLRMLFYNRSRILFSVISFRISGTKGKPYLPTDDRDQLGILIILVPIL